VFCFVLRSSPWFMYLPPLEHNRLGNHLWLFGKKLSYVKAIHHSRDGPWAFPLSLSLSLSLSLQISNCGLVWKVFSPAHYHRRLIGCLQRTWVDLLTPRLISLAVCSSTAIIPDLSRHTTRFQGYFPPKWLNCFTIRFMYSCLDLSLVRTNKETEYI